MSEEDRGTCGICRASVPLDLLVDHLSEHGVGDKEDLLEQIANAPIIDITREGSS